MIKAVIFDVGGVLVRTHDRSGRLALDRQLSLPPGTFEDLFFNSPEGQAAQLGQTSYADHWRWLQHRFNWGDEDRAAAEQAFWAGDKPDEAMVAFIRRLNSRYQTAIISNAFDNLNDVVTNLYPMADAFDLIVGSAFEKVMKPQPAIYQRTLERLGRQPHEAVFIDDFTHNVAGAEAVGMIGLHFTPQTNLAAELAKMGVTLD